MKRFLLLLLLSPILTLLAQNEEYDCANKEKYLAAYNHIRADSVNTGKTIHVIDSIADLDLHWFVDDLNKLHGEIKTLQDYFKYSWEESKYSPVLAS